MKAVSTMTTKPIKLMLLNVLMIMMEATSTIKASMYVSVWTLLSPFRA